jgi:glycosyltransferase involved in cell wall biosynthesis
MYRLLLMMEKLTFKTADIVISTNESYKKIAIERGKKRSGEVFVVRNGPGLSKIRPGFSKSIFAPPNNELKRGFDHLVAYLGNIGNQEGIDILLRAVADIVSGKGINNIKFIIIGTGPNWKKMVKSSEDMGLAKYVTFTGFIPYEEVYVILATADLCVNPEHKNSFTDKSTMVKIMDYMVFGKPIVQFDTTESRVTAGGSSIYIENNNEIAFAEAILSLLNDPGKRREMGQIGKRRIFEKLNWDKQKLNLRAAYQYLETSK